MAIESCSLVQFGSRFVISHLCAETESVAVRKSSAGIVEHTRTVHFSLKVCGCVDVLGHNNVGVTAAVFMNVVDSVVNVRNYFYGALERAVFDSHAFCSRRTESQ